MPRCFATEKYVEYIPQELKRLVAAIKHENPEFGTKRVHRACIVRGAPDDLKLARVKNVMKKLGLVQPSSNDVTITKTQTSVIATDDHALQAQSIEQSVPVTIKPTASSDHQGRIRSFAHVNGNWASHIYLCLNVNAEVKQSLSIYKKKVLVHQPHRKWFWMDEEEEEDNSCHLPRSPSSPSSPSTELHMSLSKTFCLRSHQICAFIDHLTFAVRQAPTSKQSHSPLEAVQASSEARAAEDLELHRHTQTSSAVHSSDSRSSGAVELQGLIYFENEEKTRSFACVPVVDSDRSLVLDLISRVDTVLRAFNLPTYYLNPTPHVSFGWSLTDPKESNTTGGPPASNVWEHQPDHHQLSSQEPHDLDAFKLPTNCLRCKIGNRLYTIPL